METKQHRLKHRGLDQDRGDRGVSSVCALVVMCTPPSMNSLPKAILNYKKYSFSSFCVYSLNSLLLKNLTKHLPSDPQTVSKESRTPQK